MLQNLSFKHSFKLFGALMLVIIGVSLHTVIQLYLLSEELDKMERVRFEMVSKASELRQSSADLTRFARRYVITGDSTFLKNYEKVLAIRNGLEARPRHYETVYWDLQEPTRSERHPPAIKSNLYQELQALPYSAIEREFLSEAQHYASDISHLEQDAFEAVRRIFQDDTRIENSEEQRYAISLLHSARYDRAIHRMMQPLDEFMVELNERMHREIVDKETAKQELLNSLPKMLLLNIALLLGAFLVVNSRLQQYHGELEDIGLRDELTGIRNRRYALSCGEQLLATNRRARQQVAVAVMDIDHFKQINDQYGHDAGDETLRCISHSIDRRTRNSDIFARYGGEEFLFVLGGINESNALRFSNSIRERIESLMIDAGSHKLQCTVSIGVAMSDANSDLHTLIARADKALYKAKESGRNQVVVYQAEPRQRRRSKRRTIVPG
jgi:diguanylate cyclase (GGDEF)-like protein